jgi:protein required for attachment to host cells
MTRTWVVVADSAMARVFVVPGPGAPMRELEGFAHPEARLPVRELTSDLPGRAFDSVGSGRHGMQSKVGPKEQEAIAFARFVADRIESARTGHELDRLVLVAAPAFLGRLRAALSDEARRLVDGELDLDLTRLPPDEIRRRLPESFFPEPVR